MRFDGKKVLVTGASRGIGRAIARKFAHSGASVAIHYHQELSAAEKTQSMLLAESLAGPEGDRIRRQSPLNRVASADEVAYAVLFLASEGAEFVTGTIIDVNGASYLRS